MEHDMKLSSSAVRRCRQQRGWSQEQLATASGLSLRTIQRVEAGGRASLESASSLAATFVVQLADLQEEQRPPGGRRSVPRWTEFLAGLSILSAAGLVESARVHNAPQADALAAFEILLAFVGVLLLGPSAAAFLRMRSYVAMSLALVGIPLVTLLATGLAFALVSGRSPTWQLAIMGFSGAAFLLMASRELRPVMKMPS